MPPAAQVATGSAQKASGSQMQGTTATNNSLAKSAGATAMNAAAQAASAKKKPGRPATKPQNAVQLLKADHRTVEQLFAQYENSESENEKTTLVKQVCKELIIHTMLEEEIFYPTCREKGVEEDMMDEAQVEHDSAKLMIGDLLEGEPDDEFYDAKVKVLSEYIKHHVGEEEKPRNGIFAKAQKAGVDMDALGEEIQTRKQELMGEIDENDLEAPEPRSLHVNEGSQEDYMARYSNERDRDERGRFMSEDDDDRRYSSRGSSSRSRYDEDDDDRRYSSRGRGNGGQERDSRGRFTSDYDDRGYSSRGSSSRSRDDEDDDDRRSSRGRGQGGWFGDPEGHSEASERGWEHRGRSSASRSRYDDDDDDRRSSRGRGHGGWFGDPEGHSEASERGWEHRGRSSASRSRYDDDDDDRRYASSRGGSSRDRGQGGWFGDPEGHSEAAEKGWEHRGGGRGSSRSRYDDDDDDRSSSRGRGHGGWFGDSRGHSEAARRGRGRD